MTGGDGWVLAIDTSTEIAGIALYDGQSVSELTWRSGRNQTVALLKQIRYLLDLNGLSLSSLAAVGVACGPGTFNGLRVGLSTAKGLSYGQRLPIVGVDTLEATAYPHRVSKQPIRAFVPAGRGRVVYCDYRERNGRWTRVGETQNRPFDELMTGLTEKTLVVGEIPPRLSRDDLAAEKAVFPSAALAARRPAVVAEITHQRWKNGNVDDIAALEPIYVHGTRSAAGS